jgi:hypothetical protein
MGKQTAVIIERQFIDDEGKVVVFRHPEWKVACWDAIEGLPDDEARWWALEKLLWGLWERNVGVEQIASFVRERYRRRDEQDRQDSATDSPIAGPGPANDPGI